MYRFQKWREALQSAPDVKSVQHVAQEYRDTIGRAVISALPDECQRMLSQPTLDIQGAAVILLRAELSFDGPEEQRTLLHEVAHTFAAASGRIVALHTKPN